MLEALYWNKYSVYDFGIEKKIEHLNVNIINLTLLEYLQDIFQ